MGRLLPTTVRCSFSPCCSASPRRSHRLPPPNPRIVFTKRSSPGPLRAAPRPDLGRRACAPRGARLCPPFVPRAPASRSPPRFASSLGPGSRLGLDRRTIVSMSDAVTTWSRPSWPAAPGRCFTRSAKSGTPTPARPRSGPSTAPSCRGRAPERPTLRRRAGRRAPRPSRRPCRSAGPPESGRPKRRSGRSRAARSRSARRGPRAARRQRMPAPSAAESTSRRSSSSFAVVSRRERRERVVGQPHLRRLLAREGERARGRGVGEGAREGARPPLAHLGAVLDDVPQHLDAVARQAKCSGGHRARRPTGPAARLRPQRLRRARARAGAGASARASARSPRPGKLPRRGALSCGALFCGARFCVPGGRVGDGVVEAVRGCAWAVPEGRRAPSGLGIRGGGGRLGLRRRRARRRRGPVGGRRPGRHDARSEAAALLPLSQGLGAGSKRRGVEEAGQQHLRRQELTAIVEEPFEERPGAPRAETSWRRRWQPPGLFSREERPALVRGGTEAFSARGGGGTLSRQRRVGDDAM